MIQQQPNDFLEIYFEEKYYYIVVLTKIVMFGGNIVFAFHSDGSRQNPKELLDKGNPEGFNWCTDLLLAKREGSVKRIKKLNSVERFWKTKLIKSPIGAHQWGDKVKGWSIYSVDDLQNSIETRRWMTKKYKMAMDHCCSSFDVTAERVLSKFTPDKSPWLTWKITKEEKLKRKKMYGH